MEIKKSKSCDDIEVTIKNGNMLEGSYGLTEVVQYLYSTVDELNQRLIKIEKKKWYHLAADVFVKLAAPGGIIYLLLSQ